MRKHRPRGFLVAAALPALLLSRAASPARAAGVGTAGADFLRFPAGARPAAMGGAYDALAADPYAAAVNPAGLGFASAAGISATYLSYLDSVSYDELSAAVPLRGKDGAPSGNGLGVSVQYLSPGKVAGTDASGNPIGDFNGHDVAAGLSYGRAVTRRLSFGVGAKAISAAIGNASAAAYAGDAGIMYRPAGRVSLSAVAANLGSPLRFDRSSDPLPRQYRLGAALRVVDGLEVAGQGVYEAGGTGFNAGAEWRLLDAVALRGGYQSEATQGLTGAAGLTLGMGLRYQAIAFDYAWAPMGGLGTSNFVSLVVTFGRAGASAGAGGTIQ